VTTKAIEARAFLRPASIAVIGATAAAYKAGGRRWLSAVETGTGARLYPINPVASEINGHKAYRSLRDVPERVDLAAILVPTAHVAQAVADCAEMSVSAIVVISAGFGETGPEGQAEEARLAAHVRARGGRMLGPNSAGVFSAGGGVNVLGWTVPSGNIGLVTQSGNMALTFTNYARQKRVGLSSILAVGNGADLKLSELVEMLIADDATQAVLVYCEGFAAGDGRRFIEVVRRSGCRKPIVLLKPGGSVAGRQAALSHTGALAGDDAIADAALKAAGVVRASEAEEAFDVAVALATGRRLTGRGIAVLSDGGGHATIVSDCAGRRGLELANLSAETGIRLSQILPARAGIANPVDFAGVAESDPSSVPRALDACLADPAVYGVIFAGHFGGYHLMTGHEPTQRKIAVEEQAAAESIAALVASSDKPFLLHSEHAERGLATLDPLFRCGVPVYRTLESPAKAMAALLLRNASAPLHPGKNTATVNAAITADRTRLLLEPEARARLASQGIPVPAWRTARSMAEVKSAFAMLADCGNQAVAMKLVSDRAVHKSDVGGVLLGIASPEAAVEGAAKLLDLAQRLGDPRGELLLSEMIKGSVECFIGARRDPQFGPVVLFGAGGVTVELLADVACRLAPCDADGAEALIWDTRISKLLAGYRGTAPANIAALANLVASLSRFVDEAADVLEVDLNPVIANATGAHIVDARIVVRS
jgi:acyl-CoA synthetase (NDP forming)